MASKVAPSIPKSQPHIKRACLCSPTTHPGSFRCSLHKRKPHITVPRNPSNNSHLFHSSPMPSKPHSLKPFLQLVIKPSSHDLHRRKNFHPKPTRFSLMNGNNDAVPVS
ncbi:hypothetical protein LR48_Vigan04g027300 [Vigna angularis]|uniref:Serine-rich protein n=2 Tax=Phaseolus angularis TaxID=3914 RepID=A0A0L9UAY5_PHAAN|nr:uncharacterized protein LOC128196155 [Vigna angularis]KOM40075.1 hypothetical protein LR48_Vigan04g027300 [Vigna angularis]BAT79898.1 hypothetical protein VIGAN_02283900 [Vigna angularis var. angularis]